MSKIVTFPDSLPKTTTKVKIILMDAVRYVKEDVEITEDHVVKAIAQFDIEGPYGMAKRLGLLENNSAEDMAIEFMTFVNQIFPNRY